MHTEESTPASGDALPAEADSMAVVASTNTTSSPPSGQIALPASRYSYWLMQESRLHTTREVKILTVLLTLFLLLATVMPIYNKMTYKNKYAGFPYPLSVTVFDLTATALLLAIASTIRHYWKFRKRENEIVMPEESWVGGRGFLHKTKWLLPPAAFFAVFMGLNNVGLYHIAVDIHVVLSATMVVWIIVFAFLVRRERPTLWGVACAAVVVAGGVMLGIAVEDSKMHLDISSKTALLINIIAPLFGGIHVTLLRVAILHLRFKNKNVAATERIPPMGVLEITCIKLGYAALVLWPAAIICEQGFYTTFLPNVTQPMFRALFSASFETVCFLVGSVFITMSFQSLAIAIFSRAQLTSLAILHYGKTIPTTILAMILGSEPWADELGIKRFKPTPLHVAGMVLVLLASLSYGVLKYWNLVSKGTAAPDQEDVPLQNTGSGVEECLLRENGENSSLPPHKANID